MSCGFSEIMELSLGVLDAINGATLSFLMSDIFDGKESKMAYIMQDFLQVRVNDVVRGRAGIVNKTKSAIV